MVTRFVANVANGIVLLLFRGVAVVVLSNHHRRLCRHQQLAPPSSLLGGLNMPFYKFIHNAMDEIGNARNFGHPTQSLPALGKVLPAHHLVTLLKFL
jgi:hypothetical protein